MPSNCSSPRVRPGPTRHGPDRSQHAGHERHPVQRVVPDGQRLPRGAQDDLLMRDQAGQSHRMHPDAVDRGPAGSRAPRSWSHPDPGPTPAAARAAATARAVAAAVPDGASALPAWCSSMISTDSKKRAASRANRAASTAPIAKFGTTMTPRSGLGLQPVGDRVQALLTESGGAGDHIDVVVQAEPDVVHHHVGMAEVDDHLRVRVGQREQPLPATDRGDQIHVGGLDDGLAGLRAHPAACPDHPDAQRRLGHRATLPSRITATHPRVISSVLRSQQ